MVTDGRFSSLFACLTRKYSPYGTLTGTPVAGRPGSPATLTSNALYMLESGANASKPAQVMLSK